MLVNVLYQIKHEELMVLIKGGAALDVDALKGKPEWVQDVTWLNLTELGKLGIFQDINKKV